MSQSDASTPSDEETRLRERVAALERELTEQAARTNAAIARAQDRSYWLDRWHLDLNEVMSRPWASRVRVGLRVMRAGYRLAYKARLELNEASRGLRKARASVAEERKAAERLAGEARD
jgi:hypothetical protein